MSEEKKSIFSKDNLSKAAKILVTIACLVYTMYKVEVGSLVDSLGTANYFWLVASVLALIISQLIAAQRSTVYLKAYDVPLSLMNGFRIYWLGMFYNFFVPGGIGGDVVKILAISKAKNVSKRSMTACFFLERLIGLFTIFLILSILFLFAHFPIPEFLKWIAPLFPIGALVFMGFTRTKAPILIGFVYSIFVQATQMLCIWFAMFAFDFHDDFVYMMIIFLASAIGSIVSIAGIGVREYIFYVGATFWAIEPTHATACALIFTVSSGIIGLPALLFWNKPLKEDDTPHTESHSDVTPNTDLQT